MICRTTIAILMKWYWVTLLKKMEMHKSKLTNATSIWTVTNATFQMGRRTFHPKLVKHSDLGKMQYMSLCVGFVLLSYVSLMLLQNVIRGQIPCTITYFWAYLVTNNKVTFFFSPPSLIIMTLSSLFVIIFSFRFCLDLELAILHVSYSKGNSRRPPYWQP
jgi:hypothetical protein